CVTANKFDSFRSSALRHKSLKVWVDHSVLGGNYSVARLLFPSRHRSLSGKGFLGDRHLGYCHKARHWLWNVGSEIAWKRIRIDCQKTIANRSDALVGCWNFRR